MTTTQQLTFDYGEPWKKEAYNAPIGDSEDYEGVIEIRTREELRVAEAWFPSDEDEALFSRAIACVNACAGMADPAAEIAAMREAIREAYGALTGCVDDSGELLAGRRCPTCHGKGWKLWRHARPRCGRCNGTGKDTGERSVRPTPSSLRGNQATHLPWRSRSHETQTLHHTMSTQYTLKELAEIGAKAANSCLPEGVRMCVLNGAPPHHVVARQAFTKAILDTIGYEFPKDAEREAFYTWWKANRIAFCNEEHAFQLWKVGREELRKAN